MWGTNRNKSSAEILAEGTIVGVDALRERLQNLAPHEEVFCLSIQNSEFIIPSRAILKQLEDDCLARKITLHIP